ncbi:MAG: YjbH domain-containing protein [Firmicutes bacterium]|nr:YjbH domain-containing protein [Bacillota bacterium]
MKVKKYLLVLLALIFCGLSCGTMAEAKGVFGATDLISVPTNRTLSPGKYSLGVHVNEHSRAKVQIDLGLVDDFELGAAVDLYRHTNDLSVRFKYRLIPETKDSFGLALGIQDIGKDEFSPYVVLGHQLAPYDLRWNVGIGGGRLGGLFFGLSKVFRSAQFPSVTLSGEYDAYGLNLGAKILLNKGLQLNVGVIDLEEFMFGLTITN